MAPFLEISACEPLVHPSILLSMSDSMNPMLKCTSNSGSSMTIFSEDLLELSFAAKKSLGKLQSFYSLPPNWDGNSSSAIDLDAIENADLLVRRMDRIGLRIYFISPTRNGGVMIEFDNLNGKAAEIYVYKDGASDMLLINQDDMEELAYDEQKLIHHFV